MSLEPFNPGKESRIFIRNFATCLTDALKDLRLARILRDWLRQLGPIENASDARQFAQEFARMFGQKWNLSQDVVKILAAMPSGQLELVRTACLLAANHVLATRSSIETSVKGGYARAFAVRAEISEGGKQNSKVPHLQVTIRAPQFRGEFNV